MDYKVCNITGFEGLYRVYEDGTIFSIRKNRLLKQQINNMMFSKYSYKYVTLQPKDGKPVRMPIHRIVAHHFIKPIIGLPCKLEVNHKDMDKFNNHYSNLELVTHQRNMQQARSQKTWSNGRNGFQVSKSTRQKMAENKMKKVLIYNDNQQVVFNSIQECADYFKTYRKAIYRALKSYRTFNGFNIKLL